MKSVIAGRFSRAKFLILIVSFILAIIAWFASYEYLKKDASTYQMNRPIDIKNNSGLTRMKIYIDASSVSGITFCVSAISLVLIKRFRQSSK